MTVWSRRQIACGILTHINFLQISMQDPKRKHTSKKVNDFFYYWVEGMKTQR